MTTFLCSTVLTAGADRMAQSDPHGWTLTLISVCVVFIALIILYFAYSLIGLMNTGGLRRSGRKEEPAEDEAVQAAIATALHLYLSEEVHDRESGTITFKASPRPWADASANFRKSAK